GGPTGVAPPPEEKDFKKAKGNPAEGNPTEATMLQTPINADTVFSTRCATCHGQDGKGTGPAAAALNPKPRDYSDAEWQKSVTDEQIKKTIIEGGAAVGKSPLMAPNPDLANQPVVLEGLVKIVRGFGKS
ncbi:MAG TPA: c-type cytochrome, partial [Polyangiales bacterium]|nr:c-type cytochrome [Polyangiales bacterium]